MIRINKQEPFQRVNCLETAFENDINHEKFMPYIQLFEFEGLFFSDVQAIDECVTLTLDAPSQNYIIFVTNIQHQNISMMVKTPHLPNV
jgi:hypothetical protein